MARRWALVLLVVLPCVAAWSYWGRLDGLDDVARAQRLLGSRGIWCTPKIVERVDEGVIRVVCADGKSTFAAVPSCSESFLCGTLGFDAACWEQLESFDE